jgi:synaptobrevin
LDEFIAQNPKSSWATGTPTIAMPELKEYLTKYQDPHQADSIMRIQKELDETKIVLHKTIESVLQRGEKLDDLVAKSDGLSSQSKMFYRTSPSHLSPLSPHCRRYQIDGLPLANDLLGTNRASKEAKFVLSRHVESSFFSWPATNLIKRDFCLFCTDGETFESCP